jgi:hypothetical protein
MQLFKDGITIGPHPFHVTDLTKKWLEKKDLLLTDEGEVCDWSANDSASRTPLDRADAENHSRASEAIQPQSAPEVKPEDSSTFRVRGGGLPSYELNAQNGLQSRPVAKSRRLARRARPARADDPRRLSLLLVLGLTRTAGVEERLDLGARRRGGRAAGEAAALERGRQAERAFP